MSWHPSTQQLLTKLAKNEPQALIIIGPSGSGKKSTAKWLSRQWLDIEQDPTPDHLLWLEPVNKQVTIEQVREAQQFAKLKQGQGVDRIIVIEQADTMAEPAQNALLKLLEEPAAGTALILLVTQPTNLRPTILSRAQSLRLLPVEAGQFAEHFPDLSNVEAAKLFKLSRGYVEAAQNILDQEHSALDAAKDFLTKTKFQRAALAENYNKDREAAIELTNSLLVICRGVLDQTLSQGNTTYKQWLERSQACLQAHERLIRNANIKLVLDSLALKLT